MMRALAASSSVVLEEYITSAQLKEVLTAHFKEHKLDSCTDRACVDVPIEDPMWALAAAASRAQPSSSAPAPAPKADKKAAGAAQEKAPGGKQTKEHKRLAKLPPSAAAAVEVGSDGLPVHVVSVDGHAGEEGPGGYGEEDEWLELQRRDVAEQEAAAGGRVVAGVWVPTKAPSAHLSSSGAGGAESGAWRGGGGSLTAASTWKSQGGGSKVVSLSSRGSGPEAEGAWGRGAAAGGGGDSGGAALPGGASYAETAGLQQWKTEKKEKKAAAATEAEQQGAVSVRKDVLMKYVVSKLTKCHSIQHYPGAVPIYATGTLGRVHV